MARPSPQRLWVRVALPKGMFDELTAQALRRLAVIKLSDIVERPRGDAVDEAAPAHLSRGSPRLGRLHLLGGCSVRQ